MDVERLMWLCVQVPNLKNDHQASEMQTNYVLLLKTTLDSLPALRESLQPAQTPYFRKVLKVGRSSAASVLFYFSFMCGM